MKFAQLCRLGILAVIAAFSFNAAHAQSPSSQLGVGITGGSFLGGHIAYAISPAIHIGTQFGLQIYNDDLQSTNSLEFGPYGKFILMGTPQFKPFFMAQFGIGSKSIKPEGSSSSVSNTVTKLVFAGGAEYFINRNFGAYGRIDLIDIGFGDNSYTSFGIGSASVGVEWFFD
jgi:hypothetical protein